MQQRYKVGDTVVIGAEYCENYGVAEGTEFIVEAVYTSEEEHPGYDPIGEALYGLKGFDCDLYDYELEDG